MCYTLSWKPLVYGLFVHVIVMLPCMMDDRVVLDRDVDAEAPLACSKLKPV